MNAIDPRPRRPLRRDAGRQRAALVGYLTGFDPTREGSLDLLCAACEAGLDVLELGVPFSDPSADGPTIQAAMVRALASGASLAGVLALAAELRRRFPLPIVLFGYANPLLRAGPRRSPSRPRPAGRRRPARRRPAARARADPARARPAPPGSTGSAWSRRPPPRSAAIASSRAPAASSTRSASPASPGRRSTRTTRACTRASPSCARPPSSRSWSASACAGPRTCARSAAAPTAWSSARRWSRPAPAGPAELGALVRELRAATRADRRCCVHDGQINEGVLEPYSG
jgi:hypothetical protein